MKCPNCGTEFDEGIFCPKCGTRCEGSSSGEDDTGGNNSTANKISDLNDSYSEQIKTNSSKKEKVSKPKRKISLGLIALIAGILTWLLIMTIFGSFILSIVAIVVGIQALRRKDNHKKCAIAGIILGALFYVVMVWAILTPSSSSSASTQDNNSEKITETVTTIEETVNETAEIENTIKETESNKDSKNDVRDVDIYIDYEKSSALAYKDDVIVYLDDEQIGKIKYAQTGTFHIKLKDGTHKLWLKRDTTLRKYNTNKLNLKVSSKNTSFKITAKEGSIRGLRIKLDN